MSGSLDVLALKEEDVTKFLACGTHLGTNQVDYQMEQYVYKRKPDGVHIINLRKTWEKLLLAARAIAAIENPADVCVISARPYGQRAVLKFASYVGATPIAGRFTPGAFTNQFQAAFREPRLLVITDPRIDHQPVREASYVNIPVIALCNTDSPLRYVDICIPCSNKSSHAIGVMWWMLAREVLRLRGTISREVPWDVMVDLFFYRDQEEVEKEEQAALEAKQAAAAPAAKEATAGYDSQQQDWSGELTTPAAPAAAAPEVADWASESIPVAPVPIQQGAYGAPSGTTDDWSADAGDWSAEAKPAAPQAPAAAAPQAPGDQWGGSTAENWG